MFSCCWEAQNFLQCLLNAFLKKTRNLPWKKKKQGIWTKPSFLCGGGGVIVHVQAIYVWQTTLWLFGGFWSFWKRLQEVHLWSATSDRSLPPSVSPSKSPAAGEPNFMSIYDEENLWYFNFINQFSKNCSMVPKIFSRNIDWCVLLQLGSPTTRILNHKINGFPKTVGQKSSDKLTSSSTLPETNSLPLPMDGWKMNFLLGPGLFSGASC